MESTERMRWLRHAEETVSVLLLALLFLSIALQVVTRFVFSNPPFWTEEAARYLFVWLVAIGAAEAVRARSHIAMDIFTLLLPVRPRIILGILLNTVIIACLLLLVWYGLFGTLRAHRVMSVAIGVPESWLYGALPVGAALMALRMLLTVAQDIITLRRPKPTPPGSPGSSERFL